MPLPYQQSHGQHILGKCSEKGATLLIATVVMLFASMAVLSASRSTVVMERVSSNQMQKSLANGQADSAVAQVLSDPTVIPPLLNEVLTGSPIARSVETVTLPSAGIAVSSQGEVDVRVYTRPLLGWSMDQLNSAVIEVRSTAEINNTESSVFPIYQRVVPSI